MAEIAVNETELSKICAGIPVLIIDDAIKDINNIKSGLRGLKPHNFDYSNIKVFQFEDNANGDEAFIECASQLTEAVLIADYNMRKNGVVILSYLMERFPEREYHCFIYTGQPMSDSDIREQNEKFNGKICRKSKPISELLLEIHSKIINYKNVVESSSTPTRDQLWNDILSIIDDDLKILETPPKGQKAGSIFIGGEEYSFSDLRKEIRNPESEIGNDFIMEYIHGSLMEQKFFRKKSN